MIRVTPEQYSLLREKAEGKATLAKQQRVRKRKDDLPENQVEPQINRLSRRIWLDLHQTACGNSLPALVHAGDVLRAERPGRLAGRAPNYPEG